MHTPTSTQIRFVAEQFTKVLPMAKREDHLQMIETRYCTKDHKCGTTHCHGGWYLLATRKSNEEDSFFDGIRNICNDLGFPKAYKYMAGDNPFETWVRENIELWGCKICTTLFSNRLAFYHPIKRPNGAQNLSDIIDHYLDFAARVEAIELAEKKQKLLSEPPVDTLINQTLKNNHHEKERKSFYLG